VRNRNSYIKVLTDVHDETRENAQAFPPAAGTKEKVQREAHEIKNSLIRQARNQAVITTIAQSVFCKA
jgi:hypothetical protein